MNASEMAKALGRRGGRARSQRLSAADKKRIASLGAKARCQSLQATARITDNFRYATALGVSQLNCLAGKTPAGLPAALVHQTLVNNLRHAATELKAATAELAGLDQQASRLEKQLAGLRYERDELTKQFQKLRRKVIDEQIGTEEQARIKGLLIRTHDTMKEFLKRATAAKIGRLSQLVTESFRFLLRKKTLVQRVMIDPDSFSVTLLNQTGHVVSKERLSEGEKQIFAISILWGLSQAAGRPLPAIIDTPMARLDANHRQHLVERYFPNASHQVIILSTDTEIERHYFHALLPHISRAYHLRYDEQTRETRPEEGYFWEPELAEEVPA